MVKVFLGLAVSLALLAGCEQASESEGDDEVILLTSAQLAEVLPTPDDLPDGFVPDDPLDDDYEPPPIIGGDETCGDLFSASEEFGGGLLHDRDDFDGFASVRFYRGERQTASGFTAFSTENEELLTFDGLDEVLDACDGRELFYEVLERESISTIEKKDDPLRGDDSRAVSISQSWPGVAEYAYSEYHFIRVGQHRLHLVIVSSIDSVLSDREIDDMVTTAVERLEAAL